MRTLFVTILLSITLLAGCHSVPRVDSPQIVERPSLEVSITLIGKSYELGVWVEFVLRGDWTHIVQEITLGDGSVLVECFRDDGWCVDVHTWIDRPHYRKMVVYPANVRGTDERNGFAHLPHNGLGVYTTVGPNFNEDYQRDYETRGYIEERGSMSLVWTITDDGTTITVEPFDSESKNGASDD